MNQTETYQKLIMEGIQELPPESLSEIMDFVYFIRQKTLQPDQTLQQSLNMMNREELNHLEAEFENYQEQYPHESFRNGYDGNCTLS